MASLIAQRIGCDPVISLIRNSRMMRQGSRRRNFVDVGSTLLLAQKMPGTPIQTRLTVGVVLAFHLRLSIFDQVAFRN
jgi:hypothetical protein